jgi:hypothetical protein
MDPLRFAADLLDQSGAVVEADDARVDALLPADLAERLGWDEQTRLVLQGSQGNTEERPIGYGTADLEQLLDLAREDGSVVCFRSEIQAPAGRDLAADVRRCFRFHAKGPIAVGASIRSFASYLHLHYAYAAVSEESHDGLIHFAVNEATLTPLPADAVSAGDRGARLRPGGRSAGPAAQPLLKIARAANREAGRRVLHQLKDFLRSMERRRKRDCDRLQAYYESLAQEATARKGRGRSPSQASAEERLATIRTEFDRKIRDLGVRYALRVQLRAVAAERITVPIVQASCRLRWKRADRTLPIVWNPILRDLEPLACDGCGIASRELLVNEKLDIHCLECAKGGGA